MAKEHTDLAFMLRESLFKFALTFALVFYLLGELAVIKNGQSRMNTDSSDEPADGNDHVHSA